MGGNQHTNPVTDETRADVRRLHAEGLGRNAIARKLKRSPRTISVLAEELGLTFDRTMTAVATQARVIDSKARRASIIAGLYDVAEDDLLYLKDDTYDLVEVSMGATVRYDANRLPAQDRKALITAVSTATNAAARLEALDANNGADDARSMLGQLFTRLGEVVSGHEAAEPAGEEAEGESP